MTHNKSVSRPASLRSGQTRYTAVSANTLALSVSAALLSGAASAQEDDEPVVLDTLQIEERTIDTNPYAEPGAPYKAKFSGDSRRAKPLAETPQTIQVLTQTQIKESGRSDLREILQAQPGITLGTGENGNAFGDRYIIRGHEARSDVFVDGLRDPGMTIRESFAVEQVEITKGPSSTFAGRGSTGGAINSITKQASTEYDFAKVAAGLGTDSYRRLTLDTNQKVTESTAVRVNLLHHYEDVPDRDPADRERNGAALSGFWAATDKLNFTADYYYLDAEDNPDLGTYIDSETGEPVDDLPTYLQEEDFLESTVNVFTFRTDYTFTDNLRLENAARYGTTDNGYVVTGARGTQRHETDPSAPGAPSVGLSTHQGWQEVEYFVDRLNLFFDTELAGLKNNFLFSAEYSQLDVLNGNFEVESAGAPNCITSGWRGPSEGHCMYNGEGELVSDLNQLMDRQITRGTFDSDYAVDTFSLAVTDTVEFNKNWSLFAGLRWDRFDYSNLVVDWGGEVNFYEYDDDLWNGHLGLLYQINEQGNVYLTYSTSANINGGESDVGGNCGYGGLCGDTEFQITNAQPEQTQNYELGTKWNLMDEKLLATAAIFQVTKDDVMESVGDDYAAIGTINTGENQVRGIEVSLVGQITEALSTQFGAAVMDSEVLESYDTANEGKVLSNFADESLFLQMRYQLTPAFAFGAIGSYSSELYAGQPDSAAGFNEETGEYRYAVPSYHLLDLFAVYDFNENAALRLNVGNATDEDYYLATYRSGAFTYIGDARNAHLTLTYEF